MKNIMITGGAGFIGSNFIRHMLSKYPQYNIINYDNLSYAGNLENLRSVKWNKNYTFVKGDICNFKKVENTIKKYKIDAIVHFAAETHVDNSLKNPGIFTKVNVHGTEVLLEAARRNGNIRFHHISTDEVYGSLNSEEGFFSETSRYDPNNPYSASKAASDFLVKVYNNVYNLPTTISHCSNNYGPNQHIEKFMPLAITHLMKGIKIPIYGNGKNIRDWIFVEDHCEAVDIILHKGKIGQVYGVGGNNEKTNIEIAKKIIDIFGFSHDMIEHVADRKGHDYRYAIDYFKMKKEFNWEPKHNFEEGLKKTIEWFKDNEQWWSKSKKVPRRNKWYSFTK